MIIIGITGGIGMGKTAVARMLAAWGIPVFNADDYVHRALNARGIAVTAVASAFPASYDRARQKIDRQKLGAVIFKNPRARGKLEAILHPLVRAAEERFIHRHARGGSSVIAMDIPLLFETGAQELVNVVLCVSAPPEIRRARVLSRPGMTESKFKAIIAAQMPEKTRQKKSDVILETGGTPEKTARDLQKILKQLKKSDARNRSRHRNNGV